MEDREDVIRRIRALVDRCYDSPSLFNRIILGGEPFWHKQEEMAELVVKNRSTIIVSGNAVGKSWFISRLCLWYLFTRPQSIVISTAPTHQQLSNVLWRNIRHAYTTSRLPLGGTITAGPSVSPQQLRVGDNWEAIGLSTTAVEKISGYHARYVLVLVDEASGVTPEIYEAIDGLGYDKCVLIGNPLRNTGRFYELATRAASEGTDGYLKISSLESPDVDLEVSPRGMACKSWLDEMRERYGENSTWWQSHVLAEFPNQTLDHLLQKEWLDLCLCEHVRGGPTRMGVDLAMGSGGDNSVILVRDDNGILEIQRSDQWNLEETARRASIMAEKWSVHPNRIIFDKTGLGSDFDNRMVQFGLVGTIPYQGSRTKGHTHANLRSASAWALRKRLDPGRVAGPPGPGGVVPKLPQFSIAREHMQILRPELQAIRYILDKVGNIKLEAKKEMKRRTGRSPDSADALIMSYSLMN